MHTLSGLNSNHNLKDVDVYSIYSCSNNAILFQVNMLTFSMILRQSKEP